MASFNINQEVVAEPEIVFEDGILQTKERNSSDKTVSSCETFTSKQRQKVQSNQCNGENSNWYQQSDVSFASSRGRKRRNSSNTAERKFKCICNKTFRSHFHLLQHKKTHSYTEPNVCQYCFKQYSSPGSLNNHKRTHIEENCHVCGKIFITNTNVLHYCMGLLLFCSFCSMFFDDEETLRKHQKQHYTSQRFQCSECHQCYSRADLLKQHKKMHSDQNKVLCNICYKTFSSLSNLNQHSKKFHHKNAEANLCDVCLKNAADFIIHPSCERKPSIKTCEECYQIFNV